MKYFLDTEFIEGPQKTFFNKETVPTIDLISIGIVAEDGREYYAISKDFNLKEAWNRYDIMKEWYCIDDCTQSTRDIKVYWLREHVLLPIHYELAKRGLDFDYTFTEWKDIITAREHGIYADRHYKTLKKLIKEYGKSNKQIAEDIIEFTKPVQCTSTHIPKHMCSPEQFKTDYSNPQFYGYYADYDWVCFCWLFGKMINLPKGFPMMLIDIQQQIEEYKIDKNKLLNEVPQTNCHKSLNDAIWNKKAYNWIQNEIKDRNNR